MINYTLHGESIMELECDDKHGFVDLRDMTIIKVEGDDDKEDVRNLFAYYGILEKCPFEQ